MSTDTGRDGRIKDIVKDLAARFVQLESNYTSLVTVTDIMLLDFGKRATILVTVLPDDKEEAALDFLKRKRTEFREYVKKNSKLGRIPFFDFDIDHGEKNRQRIDAIATSTDNNSNTA